MYLALVLDGTGLLIEANRIRIRFRISDRGRFGRQGQWAASASGSAFESRDREPGTEDRGGGGG